MIRWPKPYLPPINLWNVPRLENEMSDKFLRLPAVTAKVGLQQSAIYDKISAGDFPPPIKLGRVSVWLESEVDAWMRERVAEYRRAG